MLSDVRPPRRIQEAQARIATAESVLCQELGRSPKPTEVADHLGLPVDDVVEAMAADGCFSPASLDLPVGLLAPVVTQLEERDRHILYLRFFEDRTQQQIGDKLGVTQMQVSRLLSRILRNLRGELGEADPAARARIHSG